MNYYTQFAKVDQVSSEEETIPQSRLLDERQVRNNAGGLIRPHIMLQLVACHSKTRRLLSTSSRQVRVSPWSTC